MGWRRTTCSRRVAYLWAAPARYVTGASVLVPGIFGALGLWRTRQLAGRGAAAIGTCPRGARSFCGRHSARKAIRHPAGRRCFAGYPERRTGGELVALGLAVI